MKIYIETYGCSANINNSEILKGILSQSGNIIVNNEELADILIINTCIVKSKTENKIKRRIQDIARIYPDKLVIIAGCMPETDAKHIKQLNPKAILLGTHHFKDINNLLNDYKNNKISNKQKEYLDYQKEEKILLPKKPENKLISIIQISEGCLGNCTYCKTKLAKGALFSYPENKILKQIESDLNQGAKEIWLTSQDCASYGLDKNKEKSQLPDLLRKILSLKHKFKLRIGMMNPNNVYPILEELIEIYKSPKLYKFLHIPIQSASNRILSKMNRFYKIETAENIIKKFKQNFPNITIATDIILGYPEESSSDFKDNLNFIKRFNPDVLNLSKFSLHKGTEIYNQIMNRKAKQIPIKTINKRTSELMELHRKSALNKKQKFKDKIIRVFINTNKQGFYEARDDYYRIVLLNTTNHHLGKNIDVQIKQIGVHHMIGEIMV
ncbi:MAG: tRNA (N(6)-L-threonylcarbamoyladenosine(37)-C(2))-methylthiotransferase [Candidatus Pacearchaeota archaeon]